MTQGPSCLNIGHELSQEAIPDWRCVLTSKQMNKTTEAEIV